MDAPIDDVVILLGRGNHGPAPRRQLERMAALLQASERYPLVLIALIDQGEPSLPQALDACAAAGAARALVVPVSIPGETRLRAWMASVARRWQAAHPGSTMEVVLGEGLVEQPALAPALLATAQAAEAGTDVRSAPPEGWEHDPVNWSVLPPHQLHLLTCRGPRCTALDASDCWTQLRASLAEHGLREDNARTLVAATGCLYPCSCGPVLVVYPAGVWYGRLTPAAIKRIVAEHLVGGRIVEEHRITPGVPCAGQHSS
ncbi:MAG: hypothetical protein HGA45_09935 [Chloroflexales bacterium]|nr:hypothetical protein [Chloroflexales bacterium]